MNPIENPHSLEHLREKPTEQNPAELKWFAAQDRVAVKLIGEEFRGFNMLGSFTTISLRISGGFGTACSSGEGITACSAGSGSD